MIKNGKHYRRVGPEEIIKEGDKLFWYRLGEVSLKERWDKVSSSVGKSSAIQEEFFKTRDIIAKFYRETKKIRLG